jgi:hypothetical protein
MRTAALTLMLLVFAGVAVCQEPEIIHEWPTQYYPPAEVKEEPEPDCDHLSSSAARFREMRILPPSKITSFTGKEVDYVHEDKFGNYVGKLTINAETVMPKDLWKTYKGRWWWLLYCLKCGHAYNIVELSPAQLKNFKP